MERDIDAEWRDIVARSAEPPEPCDTANNGWARYAAVAGLMALAPSAGMATLPLAFPLAAAAALLGLAGLRFARRHAGVGRGLALAGIGMALVPLAVAAMAGLLGAFFVIVR